MNFKSTVTLLCFFLLTYSLRAQLDYKPAQSEETKKWGYVSQKTGETVIDFKYDQAESFYEGLGKVRLGNKWGLINPKGEKVLKIAFLEVQHYYKNFILAKSTSGWGVYTKTGEKNEKLQGYEDLFQNSYMNQDHFLFTKGRLKGLIDLGGNILIPANYDELFPCSNYEDAYIAYKGKKLGIVNLSGNVILPINYEVDEETSSQIGSDGHVAFFGKKSPLILKNGNKWGVIDLSAKELIPFKYDKIKLHISGESASSFSIGELTSGNTVSYVDSKLQPIYDEPIEGILGYYGDYSQYLIIKLPDDDQLLFYDGKKQEIVKEVDYMNHNNLKAYYSGKLNGEKYGVINYQGKVVIPFEYDRIHQLASYRAKGLEHKYFSVKKGTQTGMFEVGKGITIPIQYASVYWVDGYGTTYLTIKNSDKKTALADLQGKLLTDFSYSSIWFNRTLKAKKDGKTVILNRDGTER